MGAFKLDYGDYFYCTKKCSKSNHLGNVLTLFTDKKIPVGTGTTVSYYKADLVSSMDYSPFGAPLTGRTFNGSGSRYGFNGQEKTDEVSGSGNHLDFKYRGYDPRLGRFTAVDPLFKRYTWNSTYAFAENDVIRHVDLEGLEKGNKPTTVNTTLLTVTTANDNIKLPDGPAMKLYSETPRPVQFQFQSTEPNPVFRFLENLSSHVPGGPTENAYAGTGSSDGANYGTVTKKDVAVAVPIIIAPIAIVTASGALGVASAVLAVDQALGTAGDAATDKVGEGNTPIKSTLKAVGVSANVYDYGSLAIGVAGVVKASSNYVIKGKDGLGAAVEKAGFIAGGLSGKVSNIVKEEKKQ